MKNLSRPHLLVHLPQITLPQLHTYSRWGTFMYHCFAECACCEILRGTVWTNKHCPSVCILWVFWVLPFLAGFTTKNLYTFLSFPMHATCSTHLVILDFIVLIIFVGEPGSSIGIATDYGLDGLGSNPGGDEIFRPSKPALGPTQPPVKWVPVLSQG